jgi:hypothetical protein
MAVTHVLFVSFMIVNFILDYQTDDITDSQQSLSWEVDSSTASQEVPLHHAPLLFSQHSSGAVRPASGKSNPHSLVLFFKYSFNCYSPIYFSCLLFSGFTMKSFRVYAERDITHLFADLYNNILILKCAI